MFLRIHSKVATNEAVTTFPHRRAQSSSNDAKNSGTSALWSEKRHTYRFRWPPSCRRRSTGSAPPHSRPNLDRSQSWRSQSVETATCLPQTPGSFRMWSRSRLQRFFRSPPWAPVMHRRHRAQRLPLFLQRKGTLAGKRRSGGFFFPPFKNLWKKKKKVCQPWCSNRKIRLQAVSTFTGSEAEPQFRHKYFQNREPLCL